MTVLKKTAAAVIAALALAAPLTMQSEGLRLKAYRDPAGVVTICYGHTGPDVRMGQEKTREECEALLRQDLRVALAAVDRCAGPLPPEPRAAFADFALNIGGAAFCRSGVAKKARAGDLAGACAELSRWVYVRGHILPGLLIRREKARKLCEHSGR